MKGWEIFVHSVRLVFSNLSAAFRISFVPYAISGLAYLFLGAKAIALAETQDPDAIAAAAGGLWFGLIVYGIIAVTVSLWIAVSWHRFVLLEEYPNGWITSFHGGPIGSYFLKGLVLGLLIVGAIVVFGLTVGGLLLSMGGGVIVPLLTIAFVTFVFYRFCAVLPAAAVGEQMTLGQAWQATKGNGDSIAVLVILVVFASIALQLLGNMVGDGTVIAIAYSLVVNWIVTLVGSSVLTTFYGHFVEGRPID